MVVLNPSCHFSHPTLRKLGSQQDRSNKPAFSKKNINMFTNILFLYLSYLVKFKDLKIGVILLGVNFIAVVLRPTIKQANKQAYLMIPLTYNCSWGLHVQCYQSLGKGSQMSTAPH